MGKKNVKITRLVGGVPQIAHPDDPTAYVEECLFIISWFKEMFKRVESGNRKSTREARVALMELLFLSVTELTALALDNKNSSAQWARRLLAYIDVWIEKYRKKLGEAYEAHRRKLSTVFRNDVWEPASPLYQALHRELWLCKFYRREIPWPKAQRYLPKIQTNVVPAEYDSIMKLPPLSRKSLPDWEPKLWLLVKQHNPGLLAELHRNSSRQEIVWTYSDGSSKRQVKSRKLSWKDFRGQFRNHLKTVADCQG